jgi:hypothetical protein
MDTPAKGKAMFMPFRVSDENTMNWKECVMFSDLSEDELADLALRADELAPDTGDVEHYLVITPEGRLSVRSVLVDDITEAMSCGDIRRSGSLKQILLRFMQIYSARTT